MPFRLSKKFLVLPFLAFLGISCKKANRIKLPPPVVNVQADSVVFAIIGDFGFSGPIAAEVSALVKSWNPDFVITTGDNNYGAPDFFSMHHNIGQYYCEFIYNPEVPEEYLCEGLASQQRFNRFFPCPGNNDYNFGKIDTYEDYFYLPYLERYYDFRWGPVHFFALDSGPSGNAPCCESEQALWYEEKLTHSDKAFKLTFMHFPPFSPGSRGSTPEMQWDFHEKDVDAVVSGHDHIYARIFRNDAPNTAYLVNGLSGHPSIYECADNPLDSTAFSSFCFNESHGAILAKANDSILTFRFFSIEDPVTPVDELILMAN